MKRKTGMMRKTGRTLAAAIAVGTLTVMMSMLTFGAQKTTTTSKAVYSYTTKKQTKTYTNKSKVKAEWTYQMPVLKGSSAVVKKINAAITKNYTAQKKDYTRLKGYAKDSSQGTMFNGATFYNRTKAKVTYNKNGIFSVHYTHSWFAGGINNTWSTGETYSLKTGKRLSMTYFLKGGTEKVRNNLTMFYTVKNPSCTPEQIATLRKQKLSSFGFYRKGNTIYVCLGTEYGTTGGGVVVDLKI